jgi:AraC-like DNA-binding protein/quercetin dioxygenase-like cupin family protein
LFLGGKQKRAFSHPSAGEKMRPSNERGIINVWRPTDLHQLEAHQGFAVHRYVPRHWHEEFQFCLIEEGSADLTYRGDSHLTPPASLFIIHPGEIHSNRSFHPSGCSYRTLLIEPDAVRAAATEVYGHDYGVPFFPATVLFDRDLLALFVKLHIALEIHTSALERESLLLTFLTRLIERFGEQRPTFQGSLNRRRGSVKRACEYLIEHHAENVFLGNLAHLAGLSPFHFSRLFSEQVGMPPHAFQTQVRVARAKTLLLQGCPISQVATDTGFADQSHLTRHFKRLVGITPGLYQQGSKNVQDPSNSPC